MKETKCPNCNAPIKYQEANKKYICEYCGSEFRNDISIPKVQNTARVKTNHKNKPTEKKGMSKFLRVICASLGIFSILLCAGAISVGDIASGIILLGLGIWLNILSVRKS